MNGFNYKKKFGQNFISDTNLLKAMVKEAGITSEDEVLEIGAGNGSLTAVLCQAAKSVVAVEIDRELAPILQENLNGYDNLQLIFDDILKIETKEIEKRFKGTFKIVANLPYYITTPIIFKFIEESSKVESMSIMVQKEVAERICAGKSSKDYGILTIMINSVADSKITRIVNRNMFYPVPNVDSAVVKMNFKRKFDFDRRKFKKLVSSCFSMRRKTLVNNLLGFGLTKEAAEEMLTTLSFNIKTRAEDLSVEDYFKLYSYIYK